ncbi:MULTISPECIES: hypothetical protein [unclassified Leeuwenhoekiella]|uniref:hypothetical protein n=1 Tax=unclassified Leeuwenhoekiella TaxID=2615029 RepID=UPI000C5359DA|nr:MULTISPECIES: hypothetical protein [unclassified Leeuwenhoekiella]MAW97199.1 hypothetical protein [Leeuwenhoekiella sp.]MBA82715.1 hypothetical protein [Leeuwenhoekiella sp.]|tara:strand:+ start:26206 stop:27117 length:912 start_codon:yes stop_codon:yes gene_type:complete
MQTKTFTYLLENPDRITGEESMELRNLVKEYPFFQAARALYLKGLKNDASYLYNTELKKTAAYTQDRSVLFDYITSDFFNQTQVSEQIKNQEAHLKNMAVFEFTDVSAQLEAEEMDKANRVLDPDFFVPKEPSEEPSPEEQLQLGKPLEFNKKETHSFSEWLKLTSFKKINRETSTADTEEPKQSQQEVPSENREPQVLVSQQPITEDDPDRARRLELIDRFIESNPKIKVSPPDTGFKKTDLEDRFKPSDSLMTETLARVYVEQKNYAKAKQAYKILSLKYPEKSGFFADQIRAIEKLQENK